MPINNRYYFKKGLIKDQLKELKLNSEFDFELTEANELEDKERQIFARLLKQQGKVSGDLNLKADRCKIICIVYKDDEPIAIGGIKKKTASDFSEKKANLQYLSKEFNWELGYIYTNPKYTQKGIAKNIVKKLIESHGNDNIMATTEINDNPGMVKILRTFGFKHYGSLWKSGIHSNDLGLFLKYK